MTRPTPDIEDHDVDALACDWFARRRSGEMSERESRDLEAWLALDPAHRAALEAVERAWGELESFRAAPEILQRRARARERYRGVPRAVIARLAAAFAFAAVIGGAGAWHFVGPGFLGHRFSDQEYRTAVGERTSLTLPDGSVVTLNTDSVLRTVSSRERRLIYLDRGQAYFRVAKDARRPFVVHAAGRTVTAVGTAFDVKVDRGFEVTLVEGKVRVTAPAQGARPKSGEPAPVQTTELVAGNRFTAPDNSRWVVTRADAVKETSWITGRLRFEDEPLADVAAEFNRYSTRRIVIADPALAEQLVSGTFEAGDVESFLQTLRMAGIAHVETADGENIRLAAN